jgi:hypothetical protein
MADDATTPSQDWASKTAAQIGAGVDAVRAKTVEPLFRLPRFVGFGLIGATVGLFIAVLLFNIVVRVLTDYLFGERVWITYLILSGIFVLAGVFLWRRAKR